MQFSKQIHALTLICATIMYELLLIENREDDHSSFYANRTNTEPQTIRIIQFYVGVLCIIFTCIWLWKIHWIINKLSENTKHSTHCRSVNCLNHSLFKYPLSLNVHKLSFQHKTTNLICTWTAILLSLQVGALD